MLKDEQTRLQTDAFRTRDSQELLVPQVCTLQGFAAEAGRRHGVYIPELEPLTRLSVRTRNTRYTMTVVEPAEWKVLVRGGRFFPRERLAFLCGSGFGGTLIKVAWLGIGLCCELSAAGQRVVTSPVQSVNQADDAFPGPF